ncbi:MAG TPA: VOC family protein [Caulobacteraceae bacterium]
MRRSKIDEQNRYLLKQQRDFRIAADVVAKAWIPFEEVQAIAVIGSVAKALWKEVPRFTEFRRAGIEVWHECHDLDLALWLDSQSRLRDLRKAAAQALRRAFETGVGPSVADNQLDVFLFEPATDRYVGRLCRFNACPKGHRDCDTPGCGEIPFNKRIPDFEPHADLLATAADATLYRRGEGLLRSALDLPTAAEGADGQALQNFPGSPARGLSAPQPSDPFALKLGMIMVLAPDLAEAETFYRDILGLVLIGKGADYLVFELDGREFRVFQCAQAADARKHAASAATICVFEVASIEAEMSRMRTLGVTFIHQTPAQNIDGGFRYAAFRAPGGNVHEIMERRAGR